MLHIVVWEEEFLQLCSRKEERKERRRGERGRGRGEEEGEEERRKRGGGGWKRQEEGREKKEVKNHPFHVTQQPLLPLSVGVATIVDNSIGT